ncbi:MAG: MlaE family lipid ABC transporter permease subunit [Candidatus Cloacimonetes bacterium]|nr:MlaE family lipid ABC transporter permease subunit [Candidatus Cloacimonadota bacterium]
MKDKVELIITDNHIKLIGRVSKETIPALWKQFKELEALSELQGVDLSEVSSIDSAGVLFIEELAKKIKGESSKVSDKQVDDLLKNYSEEIGFSLQIFGQKSLPEVAPITAVGLFEKLGESYYFIRDAIYEYLILSADVFYWAIKGLWKKKGARKGSLIQQSIIIGVDSLPIIFTLSFIIGLIIALQSAAQLRMFGANIFIADLISISMVREMGPMMTAIILAGRSGSSIASEIATMKVTEEIDALKMMAINPIRYVVVPKFYAMTICMPLLVVISMIVGILGGIIVAVTYLNLSVSAFYTQMLNVLFLKDLLISLLKSTFFGWSIVIIGSFYGFRVEGGAEGVGRATTLSVVTSIFAVIIIDVLFSLLYLQ